MVLTLELGLAFAAGAVTVMFIPPKYEDFARSWLVSKVGGWF